MSSSDVDPMAGVILYNNREQVGPEMDGPTTTHKVVSTQARRAARRQERQRRAKRRDSERAALIAAKETQQKQYAEARRRKTVEMAAIQALQVEVFELITQQDAWNCTFRSRFKKRLGYKLGVQMRNERFILGADGKIWTMLWENKYFVPFQHFENSFINERLRAELMTRLELARSDLKLR